MPCQVIIPLLVSAVSTASIQARKHGAQGSAHFHTHLLQEGMGKAAPIPPKGPRHKLAQRSKEPGGKTKLGQTLRFRVCAKEKWHSLAGWISSCSQRRGKSSGLGRGGASIAIQVKRHGKSGLFSVSAQSAVPALLWGQEINL